MHDDDPEWRSKIALTNPRMTLDDAFIMGYVVDGIIDAEAARRALDLVVERTPLFGARIRPDVQSSSGYILAVPAAFSAQHPPFLYTTSTHPTIALDSVYPIRAKTSEACTYPLPNWPLRVKVFSPDKSAPTSFKTYLDRPSFFGRKATKSTPILYLHIAAYGDSQTVVGLRFAHAAFDEVGLALVLREWESAMRDPEAYASLPPVIGTLSKDIQEPLAGYLVDHPVASTRSWIPQGWKTHSFWDVLRYLFINLRRRMMNIYDARLLRVPSDFIATLVTQANKSLKKTESGEEAFVSSGDMISAILWKASLAPDGPSATPTTLFQVGNLRPHGPKLPKPWIGSTVILHLTTPSISLKDLIKTPLMDLAFAIRRSLITNTTEMVGRTMAWRLRNIKDKIRAFPLMSPDQRYVSISNRVKTGASKVDFSSVIMPASKDGEKKSGDGSILDVFCVGAPRLMQFDAFGIRISADGSTYDIEGKARKETWEAIVQAWRTYKDLPENMVTDATALAMTKAKAA